MTDGLSKYSNGLYPLLTKTPTQVSARAAEAQRIIRRLLAPGAGAGAGAGGGGGGDAVPSPGGLEARSLSVLSVTSRTSYHSEPDASGQKTPSPAKRLRRAPTPRSALGRDLCMVKFTHGSRIHLCLGQAL